MGGQFQPQQRSFNDQARDNVFPWRRFLNNPNTPPFAPTTTIQRFTLATLQERCHCGLCFHCNEPFTPKHDCKKLFLIELDLNKVVDTDDDEDLVVALVAEETETTEISLYALVGVPTLQMMCIRAKVARMSITVLVDSRSAHNLLHETLISK